MPAAAGRHALVVALALALGAACAPSTADVQRARAARYRAPDATLFALTRAAIGESYAIAESDPVWLAIKTTQEWYTPAGTRDVKVEAGVGDSVVIQADAIRLGFVVQLARDGDAVTIQITTVVHRYDRDSGRSRKLAPDDASLPGWVQGKADVLAVAIHARLEPHGAAAGP